MYKRQANKVGVHKRKMKNGKVVTVRGYTRKASNVKSYSRANKGMGKKVRAASGKMVYVKRGV
ncbi:hypothetical protein [Flammeovirga agarivorans]|uniref:Uncharacterized protein n=1 Tax=Flammeovirga agarivorans TaxID=2726742 RepID=A0A7X8XZA9_9BACT|nr:hypothetical protein [Flammeovirga agarivorans]NLR94878.1 hypothetical protein [Flammeovirga agarivorans]